MIRIKMMTYDNRRVIPMAHHEWGKRYLNAGLPTYLGNKRNLIYLLDFAFVEVKLRLGRVTLKCLDLFSGSGFVSRVMKGFSHYLVSNDFEDYAEIINRCYLHNFFDFDMESYLVERDKLLHRIKTDWKRGFIAKNYAPIDDSNIQPGERVFFTRRNAEFIDTARQHIDRIPESLRVFFLGPLLVRASIHCNTSGVFKGFHKNRAGIGAFGGEHGHALKRIKGNIEIDKPTFAYWEVETKVTKYDATQFSKCFGGSYDMVYLDPPYNQHPYGSNYFMLNLIANYEEPKSVSKVSGIPPDWRRSIFNNRRQAPQALLEIIDDIDTHFFAISYNNEGFIDKDWFVSELEKRGKLSVFEEPYNAYRGSRYLSRREKYVVEYLYLLERG